MQLIIEMGGTKINFYVVTESLLTDKFTVPTTHPEDFKDYISKRFKGQTIRKLIFACFGPISLDSYNYGEILNTPKRSWSHVNIYSWLKQNICDDVVLVTDVALPALGAVEKYALKDSFFSYLNVGTGIGGCNIFKGTILQNEVHPEIGHMYLGCQDGSWCGYHSHCFEGQTSGSHFSRKYKLQFRDVDSGHPGRVELIQNLAILIYNMYAGLGVGYVVLGGGVIKANMKSQLVKNLKEIDSGYLPILSKNNLDHRLILDDKSDDLSLAGGVFLLDSAYK